MRQPPENSRVRCCIMSLSNPSPAPPTRPTRLVRPAAPGAASRACCAAAAPRDAHRKVRRATGEDGGCVALGGVAVEGLEPLVHLPPAPPHRTCAADSRDWVWP